MSELPALGEAARSAFTATVALLAGYAFIRLSYFRRFSTEPLRTDRFALHVLGYSFVLFLIGNVAAELLPHWTPSGLVSIEESLASSGVTAAVINAIALGGMLAATDNLRVRFLMRNDPALRASTGFFQGIRIAAVARFVRQSNDSALRAIFRATLLKKNLLVTLKSNKVYVGKPYVLLWDDPTQALTFIKILPVKSGYREPLTRKVVFTTRYDILLDRLVELSGSRSVQKDATDPLASDLMGLADDGDALVAEVDLEDLGIVIAWAQVESLTLYDDNLYAALQVQHLATPFRLANAG